MASAALSVLERRGSLVVHRTIDSIRSVRRSLDPSVSVGFVPTMGALHEGHLSLVREARACNDVVVASVFVNPTQFGKGEDLNKYPRQLERDTELLESQDVDHVFAPDAASMYGKNHVTYVEPEGFDQIAEGIARPGHFRGVATVVTKLFNIVHPTNAYFGQKDAAQCVLIRRIVDDLNMDVNVVVKETMREDNGLAMSSRNAYLTLEERRAASVLYRSLCAARDVLEECTAQNPAARVPATLLQDTVQRVLRQEPLVSEIQYIAVDSKATMRQCEHVTKSEGAIVSIACKVGAVRLIDNIVL